MSRAGVSYLKGEMEIPERERIIDHDEPVFIGTEKKIKREFLGRNLLASTNSVSTPMIWDSLASLVEVECKTALTG